MGCTQLATGIPRRGRVCPLRTGEGGGRCVPPASISGDAHGTKKLLSGPSERPRPNCGEDAIVGAAHAARTPDLGAHLPRNTQCRPHLPPLWHLSPDAAQVATTLRCRRPARPSIARPHPPPPRPDQADARACRACAHAAPHAQPRLEAPAGGALARRRDTALDLYAAQGPLARGGASAAPSQAGAPLQTLQPPPRGRPCANRLNEGRQWTLPVHCHR